MSTLPSDERVESAIGSIQLKSIMHEKHRQLVTDDKDYQRNISAQRDKNSRIRAKAQPFPKLVQQLQEALPSMNAFLESNGFSYRGTNDGAALYTKESPQTIIVWLHQIAKVTSNTAGSFGVDIVGGALYFSYHLPIPAPGKAEEIAANLLLSGSTPEALQTLAALNEELFNHELSHLACVLAATPWGKVLFSKLVLTEYERYCGQASDTATQELEEKPPLTVSPLLAEVIEQREFSDDELSAAMLISELRAHSYNRRSDQKVAATCLCVLADAESTLGEHDGKLPQSELCRIGLNLKAVAEILEVKGYKLVNDGMIEKALDFIVQRGSLRTPFDPSYCSDIEKRYFSAN